MFMCACVSPDDPTFLGDVSRFFTGTIPNTLELAVRRIPVVGPFVIDGSVKLFNWVVFKPNPLLQIVYAVLVFGGYAVVVWQAYPRIPNPYMAGYHKWIGVFVVGATIWAWYKACSVSPGYITHDNWRTFDNYRICDLMYFPDKWYTFKEEDERKGRVPSRPNIPKLPRSKMDAFTGKVISRFDHFCPWLNNPVGERNYRYFLLFLFMTAFMLFYGTVATLSVVMTFIVEKNLFDARYVNKRTGKVIKASKRMVFHYCMHKEQYMMMLLFLCGIMGIVVAAFFMYHLYLVSQNKTTNEGFKWSRAQSRWQHLEQERVRKLLSKVNQEEKESTTQSKLGRNKIKAKFKERKKGRCNCALLAPWVSMWCNGVFMISCGMVGHRLLTAEEKEEEKKRLEREMYDPSFAIQPCPKYPYKLESLWLNFAEVIWPRSERLGRSGPIEGGWDSRHEEVRRNLIVKKAKISAGTKKSKTKRKGD